MDKDALEQLVLDLASMDRSALIHLLRTMRCTLPLDFTDEFLGTISLDRLRHITLAASMHQVDRKCA
jgi:hypothetical protein